MGKFYFEVIGREECDYCHQVIIQGEKSWQFEDEEAVYCDNCINRIT